MLLLWFELGSSGISDLDEKVLPIYRQGPPIHTLFRVEVYVTSATCSPPPLTEREKGEQLRKERQ